MQLKIASVIYRDDGHKGAIKYDFTSMLVEQNVIILYQPNSSSTIIPIDMIECMRTYIKEEL